MKREKSRLSANPRELARIQNNLTQGRKGAKTQGKDYLDAIANTGK